MSRRDDRNQADAVSATPPCVKGTGVSAMGYEDRALILIIHAGPATVVNFQKSHLQSNALWLLILHIINIEKMRNYAKEIKCGAPCVLPLAQFPQLWTHFLDPRTVLLDGILLLYWEHVCVALSPLTSRAMPRLSRLHRRRRRSPLRKMQTRPCSPMAANVVQT